MELELFLKQIFMLILMKVCGRIEEGLFWPLVNAEESEFPGFRILTAGPVSGKFWVLLSYNPQEILSVAKRKPSGGNLEKALPQGCEKALDERS